MTTENSTHNRIQHKIALLLWSQMPVTTEQAKHGTNVASLEWIYIYRERDTDMVPVVVVRQKTKL